MNCKKIQRYCIENAGEELSAECLEHLVACEPCRKVYERALGLCKLVSLKRHEAPDPGFEQRCQSAIERRIDAYEAQPRVFGWRIWELFDEAPMPALRYAMAASVVALMALHVMMVEQLPSLESPAYNRAETAETAPPDGPAMASDTNPAAAAVAEARPADVIFQVASNVQPRGMQYGPGPSRLVGFEY